MDRCEIPGAVGDVFSESIETAIHAKTNKSRDLAAVQKDLRLAGLRIGASAKDAGCGKSIRG